LKNRAFCCLLLQTLRAIQLLAALDVRPKFIWMLIFYVLIFSTFGCESRSESALFVIPGGFRGGIIVETNGGESIDKKDDYYVLHVPQNGIVKLDGPQVFKRMHRLVAQYSDGTPLLVGTNDLASIPENVIAFWQVGIDSTGYRMYFVGTKQEITLLSINPRLLYQALHEGELAEHVRPVGPHDPRGDRHQSTRGIQGLAGVSASGREHVEGLVRDG